MSELESSSDSESVEPKPPAASEPQAHKPKPRRWKTWIAAIGLGAVLATVVQQLLVQFISSSPGVILGWVNQKQWIDKTELEELRRPHIGAVSEVIWFATDDGCYSSVKDWLKDNEYEDTWSNPTRRSIEFAYKDHHYIAHCASGFNGTNQAVAFISGVSNDAALLHLEKSLEQHFDRQFRQWDEIREQAPGWWNAPVPYQYDYYVKLTTTSDRSEILLREGVLPSSITDYFENRGAKVHDCFWSVVNSRVCRYSLPGLLLSMRLVPSGGETEIAFLITATTFKYGDGRAWTSNQIARLVFDIPGVSLAEN